MKKDQLNLFKEPSKLKVGVDYNTVDVASIIPNHNIIPNRYFMKPTGGLHPFAVFHERLNTGDFPYIINTNYKGKGTSKVQHVVIRDTIEYPYVMLQSLDKRKNNNPFISPILNISSLVLTLAPLEFSDLVTNLKFLSL